MCHILWELQFEVFLNCAVHNACEHVPDTHGPTGTAQADASFTDLCM